MFSRCHYLRIALRSVVVQECEEEVHLAAAIRMPRKQDMLISNH